MKHIKINFYLDKPTSESSSILARFGYNGKSLKYYPGISVTTKDWSKNKMRVDHRKAMSWEINDQINKVEKAINNVLISFQKNNVEEITSKQLKFAVDSEIERVDNEDPEIVVTEYVLDFFNAWIVRKAAKKKEYFKRRWHTTVEHALLARPLLKFVDINDDFFHDYTAYLIDVEENVNNTINGKVKRMQQLCREALKYGHKVNPHYNDFSFPGERLPAIYLRWEEVELLENLTGLDEKEQYILDRFIFRCYTGIRFSDMEHLNRHMISNNGGIQVLRFDMVKQGKGHDIFLPKKALEVWERNGYIFNDPKFRHTQIENEVIKILMRRTKVTREVQILRHKGADIVVEVKPIHKVISSHTARRSFARAWYERGGDLNKLREYLGHSDLSTTLRYIGLEKDETNREAARLFG